MKYVQTPEVLFGDIDLQPKFQRALANLRQSDHAWFFLATTLELFPSWLG